MKKDAITYSTDFQRIEDRMQIMAAVLPSLPAKNFTIFYLALQIVKVHDSHVSQRGIVKRCCPPLYYAYVLHINNQFLKFGFTAIMIVRIISIMY